MCSLPQVSESKGKHFPELGPHPTVLGTSLEAQTIESVCNAGDQGSILGSGRCPGGGHGNPLQYSCLGNPMDRGVPWATVHGVAKSQTQLSD